MWNLLGSADGAVVVVEDPPGSIPRDQHDGAEGGSDRGHRDRTLRALNAVNRTGCNDMVDGGRVVEDDQDRAILTASGGEPGYWQRQTHAAQRRGSTKASGAADCRSLWTWRYNDRLTVHCVLRDQGRQRSLEQGWIGADSPEEVLRFQV